MGTKKGTQSGTGSANSPCTGPIYHNKHTKETHLGFGERFGFDLIAQKSEMIARPSVRPSASISASASAVGRPWHHKLQTDSLVCANNNVDSYSFSSLVSRCASNGFRFQFRFHGQCQRRATVPSRVESSWETESESESGWAPLKLDAICVQLGYANLPEPCQSTASPAAT